jgi:UDP-2,3-diacylglucosamine pyrophosphatase LpxH
VINLQEATLPFVIDKPTFLISDLHLGDGAKADNFLQSRAEQPLLHFFDLVAQQGKRLIIDGDLFELWKFNLPICLKAYSSILAKLQQLADNGVEIFFVFGNHDFDLSYLHPLFHFVFENYDFGDHIHIEHGHRFDKDTGFTWKIRKAAVWLVSWLERLIDRNIDENLDRLLQKFKIFQPKTPASKRYHGTYIEYENEVEKLLKKYQLVILGHTHKPLLKRLTEHGIYANSGTWVQGRRDYIFIEGNRIVLDEFKA